MEEMFSKICFCHFWQKEVHKIRVSEPEPIFYLAGAAFFKAVPAASFWQAKKESLVFTKHNFKAVYNGKCDPKKTYINNSLFKN